METEPPQDLRRLVHSTANRMLEESLRNLRQHNEVRRLIARGDLTDLELNAAYHDYERQAGAFYRQAVADLTVRYHASLAELGVDYSRRFYDEILTKYADGVDGRPAGAGPSWSFTTSAEGRDATASSRATSVDGQRPKRVALELHAPSGAVASGAFTLENRRDEPAEVSFEVSRWTASDGQPGRSAGGAFTARAADRPSRQRGRDHCRPFGPGRIRPRSAVHHQHRGQRL